ncbi:TetR/AcrR family transcriptional repressor of nem operon [Kitasatospora sp. MAA4]|uniref:TetR/AcrR family transcriptional regulator n=1 Tax=Kitasatospora sp. MAA4 TaxID=3035093 RepID=UPI0024750452|nr:TetR/AcrR family transcriptional regulator [Kitasatospora sp. MAA4]MDH6133524.1 TetR/AcrR family transcriptional repressor of nem operon [Kitasatospora sp. MAA4]
MVRTRDPEGKRAALLEAGLRLAGNGLQSLSVNDITAEAKVAKGTFYVHFINRADFVLAMHRSFFEGTVERIRTAVAAHPPGREAILAGAYAYLDACLDQPALKALLLEARFEPLVQEEVAARNENHARFAAPLFAAMGRSEPEICARLFVALTSEAALLELTAGGPDPAVRRALAGFLEATPS